MITRTMNAEELDREMLADKPNVENYILSKLDRVKRFIKTRTPFRYYSTFNTKRKNKWMIVWSYTGRDYKNVYSFPVSLLETPEGVYACTMVFGEQAHFSIYVPHFFSRYALRCGVDKSGIELIAHYFYNNLDYSYIHHYEKGAEHEHLVEQVTREGVAFGFFYDNGIGMLYRTFITLEMAKGEQIPVFLRKAVERYLNNEVDKPQTCPWAVVR